MKNHIDLDCGSTSAEIVSSARNRTEQNKLTSEVIDQITITLKTVRTFISSTFFDVDLRWGVYAKDANGETANSWEYCRQWIDRVEPVFVGILGWRYGWEPEPM